MSALPESFASRPTAYARRQRLVRRLAIWGVVVIAVLIWLRYFTIFGVFWQFARIESRVKNHITGDQLQKWALTVLEQRTYEDHILLADLNPPLPDALRDAFRSLPTVYAYPTDQNGPGYVRVIWGGGFIGHCGFDIGSADFSNKGRWSRKWQDGIYFWSGP